MTIRSRISCDDLPFQVPTAVVNLARPPPANDMLPLLCPALLRPLVQPLREVNGPSDFEVDVAVIRFVCGSSIVSFVTSRARFGLTSNLKGVYVSWDVRSGRGLRHFRSKRCLGIGVQVAGYPI